jgi:hypothetical protein
MMEPDMKKTMTTSLSLALLSWLFTSCGADPTDPGGAEGDYWEGVEYDEENPYASVGGGKEDGNSYEVPTDLPELAAPEIIVSLENRTVHLFDRRTGFSEVYPAGVGVLNSNGVSITPTGHFTTSPDTSDGWWYIARRWSPEIFGGFPFIRLTAENSRHENTYGLHGPITAELIWGFVSHGCVRMRGEDVVRIFYLIRRHGSTPVTIQREPEIDAEGNQVAFDAEVQRSSDQYVLINEIALWEVGQAITYGSSVGDAPPRDDTGTDTSGCADDWLELEGGGDVPLEPGTTRGLILCKGDTDRYAVTLSAGQRLAAQIHFVSAISDIDLRVFSPDGVQVGQSAGTTDDETVELTAATDGTYVIEIYMYGDGENNGYSLDMTIN